MSVECSTKAPDHWEVVRSHCVLVQNIIPCKIRIVDILNPRFDIADSGS
ncbi:uncharacterized protein CMC5_077230 [Chondromyces crocatus]|uniref:Uncharacterized protein n=1 Tax=Chondromyces crocatus TaxID=52 RepID=A0A0K1ERL9_CHOCO|nr:uncharacterized protein CMC5_077230 [Chondromyces crocatus]